MLVRLILLVCLLGVASCAPAVDDDSLTVAAAASLAPVFEALKAQFESQTGIRVNFSYGSTGSLAEQIRNGGPFDVFASADATRVDDLIEEGLLTASSRTEFAHGRLVLVASPIMSFSLSSLESLLDPAVKRIALANPAHAPYGLAATQALSNAGIWGAVQPKLVYAESVRQAGQMVLSGNASAGLLAYPTALSIDLPIFELPLDLHDPVLHLAAIHADSPYPDRAGAFLSFLTGPDGQSKLEAYGLMIPER